MSMAGRRRVIVLFLLSCLLLHQVLASDQEALLDTTNVAPQFSQMSLSGVVTRGEKHDYCTAVKSAGDYIVSFDVQTTPSGAKDMTLYGCATLHTNMTLFDPMGKQLSQLVSQPYGLPGVYWTCDVHFMCGSGAQILYDWMPLLGPSFSLPNNVGIPSGPNVNISYLVMKVAYASDATEADYGSLQGLRVRYNNSVSVHAAAYMIMSASKQQLLPDLKDGTKVQMMCAFESIIGVQHFSDDPVIAPSSNKDERFVLTYIKNSTDKLNLFNHESISDESVEQHDNWKTVLKWYLLNKGRDLRLPKTMYGLDSQQSALTIGDYMMVRCTNESSQNLTKLYFVFPSTFDVCCFVRTNNLNVRIDRRDKTLRRLCSQSQSQPKQASVPPEIPIATVVQVQEVVTTVPNMLNGEKNVDLPATATPTALSTEEGMKSGHCGMMDLFLKLQNGTVTLPHRGSKKTSSKNSPKSAETEIEEEFNQDGEPSTTGEPQNATSEQPLWKQAGAKYKQASDWVAERTGLSNSSITLIPIASGILIFCFMLICCIAILRRRGAVCKRRSEWSALRRGERAYDRELLIRADDEADDEEEADNAEDEHFTRTARRPVSLNGHNGSAVYNTHRLVVE